MLGQDIYANMPTTTDKIMFEGANSGYGFAAYPSGEVSEYALNWLKYQVLGDMSSCEALLNYPSSASQYLTNFECSSSMVEMLMTMTLSTHTSKTKIIYLLSCYI